ncbi:Hypothetical predicted protein [Paramuricea clavata]|uniref:Uncharacterized protein n=1 Tax=Paramuricea clavata TaxID=317549 RepID=A0A7D9DL79_PARCT|nr:Hypothetical predicted protein [Paramuricea clavata]
MFLAKEQGRGPLGDLYDDDSDYDVSLGNLYNRKAVSKDDKPKDKEESGTEASSESENMSENKQRPKACPRCGHDSLVLLKHLKNTHKIDDAEAKWITVKLRLVKENKEEENKLGGKCWRFSASESCSISPSQDPNHSVSATDLATQMTHNLSTANQHYHMDDRVKQKMIAGQYLDILTKEGATKKATSAEKQQQQQRMTLARNQEHHHQKAH